MWIQKAEILLELGLYQPARHLLLEAHMIARELDDKAAQAQCLYFFAVLANSEMNHGQAKALLEEAQSIGGDENFWFNLTLCLVKAIIEENSKYKDNMMRNLTLPLLRKLANLKFSLVDLTLDMLHLVCAEEKQQALAEERKGSAQTIVEAFVRCTPNCSSVQQDARIVAQQYLAQASEVLAQATSLSLNNKFTEILAAACLNMLECIGQFDPVSSGQYLALYQSYANLSINPQHLNHLNELPPNFKIVILQHSEDRMGTPSASTAESGKTKDKDKEQKPAADKALPDHLVVTSQEVLPYHLRRKKRNGFLRMTVLIPRWAGQSASSQEGAYRQLWYKELSNTYPMGRDIP
ncbi:UNVERIFIED_CONTAM: hypothetical protein FKN15_044196 [Acipenser sinensis]